MRPEHGAQLVCHGRVRAYEPQGVYQLYVESVTPWAPEISTPSTRLSAGSSRPRACSRSRANGRPALAAPHRCRDLAGWRGVGRHLHRAAPPVPDGRGRFLADRGPGRHRGAGHHPRPQAALRVADLDLVILARGGGSIEDLWAFNDEQVVRTVVASPFPVVVGVGHESDVTLADFAADRRAPTPSAAAEISVPDGTQLPAILNRLAERSTAAMSARMEDRAAHSPRRGTSPGWPQTGPCRQPSASRRAARSIVPRDHADLERRQLTAAGLRDSLRALGPLATLDRGYAVARRADGSIVRDPSDVTTGDALEVVVARGAVDTRVTAVRPGAVEELLVTDQPADHAADDLAGRPFDELVAELQRIVQTLEAGRVGLEESITLYREGLRLHAACEERLKAAELTITELGRRGLAGAEPNPDTVSPSPESDSEARG